MVDGTSGVDADQRMDGRDGQRHVGHVGREGGRRDTVVVEREPATQILGVGPIGLEQTWVALHVGVDRGELFVAHRCSGGGGPGLEARFDPRLELLQVPERQRPAHEPSRDHGGDDVGCRAPVGDHPVHLVAGTHLLAEQSDAHLGDGHGVGGVDAFPWRRRRMGVLAGVVHVEVGHGQARGGQPLCRPRVHHHRCVNAVEDPPLEQHDLPAPTFLGRSADHLDGQPQVVGQGGQPQTGSHRAGGDDVVPAGVAHHR